MNKNWYKTRQDTISCKLMSWTRTDSLWRRTVEWAFYKEFEILENHLHSLFHSHQGSFSFYSNRVRISASWKVINIQTMNCVSNQEEQKQADDEQDLGSLKQVIARMFEKETQYVCRDENAIEKWSEGVFGSPVTIVIQSLTRIDLKSNARYEICKWMYKVSRLYVRRQVIRLLNVHQCSTFYFCQLLKGCRSLSIWSRNCHHCHVILW